MDAPWWNPLTWMNFVRELLREDEPPLRPICTTHRLYVQKLEERRLPSVPTPWGFTGDVAASYTVNGVTDTRIIPSTLAEFQGILGSGDLVNYGVSGNPSFTNGSYTADVTWGDGHTDVGTFGTFTNSGQTYYDVSDSHDYLSAGTFTLVVDMVDGVNTIAAADMVAIIGPTLTGVGQNVTATYSQGFSSTLGVFTDNESLTSDFANTIFWGDGSTSSGSVTALSNSGGEYTYALTGSHTYTGTGYTATAISFNVYDHSTGTLSVTDSLTLFGSVTAVSDSASTPLNTALTMTPETNDIIPSGDAPITLTVTQPTYGSISVSGSTLVVHPAAGYYGTETFQYTISDSHGHTSTAIDTVTVGATSTLLAAPDSTSTPLNTAVTIAVESNDTIPASDTVSISLTQPTFGSVTLSGTSVVLTPATGDYGVQTFKYTLSDSYGHTSTTTDTVTVGPTSTLLAVPDYASTPLNTAVTIAVKSNDTIPAGDTVTLSLSQPAYGSVTLSGSSVVFTPAEGDFGVRTFGYTLSDSYGHISTAIDSVTIGAGATLLAVGDVATTTHASLTEQGQMVCVRSRNWMVTDVLPSTLPPAHLQTGMESPQHLVTLSSVEDDGLGEELQVIWQLELAGRIVEKVALPDPTGFDPPDQLGAFLDAVRWGASSSADVRNIHSPFRAGIDIEDYQLDPVVRAIQMPRVNLLIADDVGLGKTIEAGMVALELIIRHRTRKILIVCPSS